MCFCLSAQATSRFSSRQFPFQECSDFRMTYIHIYYIHTFLLICVCAFKNTHAHKYIPGCFLYDAQEDCCYYWKLEWTSCNPTYISLWKYKQRRQSTPSVTNLGEVGTEKAKEKESTAVRWEGFQVANANTDWKHGSCHSYQKEAVQQWWWCRAWKKESGSYYRAALWGEQVPHPLYVPQFLLPCRKPAVSPSSQRCSQNAPRWVTPEHPAAAGIAAAQRGSAGAWCCTAGEME